MPECSYCGEELADEDAHLAHLRDEHSAALGSIDRRRVAELDDDGGGIPTGPLVIGGVLLVAIAVVGYVTLFAGGADGVEAGQEPGSYGSAHEHGTMEVVILGEAIDFSRARYQLQADRFHFEAGDGEVWHAHADGVTLEWAMDTLGIDVTSDSVTVDGTTYRDADPEYAVTVAVNGEPVDPSRYVLEGASAAAAAQGDRVRILVERANATG